MFKQKIDKVILLILDLSMVKILIRSSIHPSMTGQGNSADCATVNSTEMQRGTYALAVNSNKLTYLTSERCSDIAYGGKEETKNK